VAGIDDHEATGREPLIEKLTVGEWSNAVVAAVLWLITIALPAPVSATGRDRN
jgi:hypothetical protein